MNAEQDTGFDTVASSVLRALAGPDARLRDDQRVAVEALGRPGARVVVVVRGARVVGAVRVGAVVGATVVASAVGRLDEVVDVLEEDDELELDELDETDDEFDGVADVLDATEAGSWESLLLP